MKAVRGIRGAIRVAHNSREAIHQATRDLLLEIMKANELEMNQIASVFLTATPDLNADFPAYAARSLGWTHIPLLCAQEIDVPGSMSKVIRVLMHVNTDKTARELRHQYLGETTALRPDLVNNGSGDGDHGDERGHSSPITAVREDTVDR